MKRRDLRRGRRSNRAALGRFLLVVIIGVGLVWFGLSLRPTSTPKKAATVKIEKASEKEVEEKSVVDQRTFLIIGVDKGAEKDLVTEVLVVVFDPAGNRINGMIIDPDTYVAILQRWGTMSFTECIQGALELAERGFPAHFAHVSGISSHYPGEYDKAFWFQYGRLPKYGELIVNKDLGKTFRIMIDAEQKALADGFETSA